MYIHRTSIYVFTYKYMPSFLLALLLVSSISFMQDILFISYFLYFAFISFRDAENCKTHTPTWIRNHYSYCIVDLRRSAQCVSPFSACFVCLLQFQTSSCCVCHTPLMSFCIWLHIICGTGRKTGGKKIAFLYIFIAATWKVIGDCVFVHVIQ